MPEHLTFSRVGFYIEAMTESESAGFDPAAYYTFDLRVGAVRNRHGDRVLVFSADAIGPLVSTAARHGDLTSVRTFGKRMGEYAAQSLSSEAGSAAPEAVLNSASGTLALLGWGQLSFERWGRALVLCLEGAPTLDAGRLGLAAMLGGLFTALGGRDVACVPVGEASRFIVVHPQVAETVWTWTKEGADLPQVVARLMPEAA